MTPTYAPQNHHADFGGANTEIHGMFFSGRHAQYTPLSVDGTIVAYETQTQGSANYVYNLYWPASKTRLPRERAPDGRASRRSRGEEPTFRHRAGRTPCGGHVLTD